MQERASRHRESTSRRELVKVELTVEAARSNRQVTAPARASDSALCPLPRRSSRRSRREAFSHKGRGEMRSPRRRLIRGRSSADRATRFTLGAMRRLRSRASERAKGAFRPARSGHTGGASRAVHGEGCLPVRGRHSGSRLGATQLRQCFYARLCLDSARPRNPVISSESVDGSGTTAHTPGLFMTRA